MDTAAGGILGVTKTGSGTWVLGANNGYTGDTVVEDGILRLDGTLSQSDVIVNGGTLKLGTGNRINDWADLTVASGAVFDMAGFGEEVGSLSGGGLITNGGTGARSVLTVDIAGSSTFSGTIDQQNDDTEYMQLYKKGAGTLTLTGDNNYRNLLIYEGTVQVDSADALGSGRWADQIGKGDTDGTLEFIGDTDTTYSHDWTIGDANDIDGTGNAIIKSSTTDGSKVVITRGNSGNKPTVGRTLTLSGVSVADNEISGQLTDHADGGNVGVIKDGTGKWILSGSNNYAGTTTINEGSLVFKKKGSLYNNVEANWTEANITVKSGATLAVGTYSSGSHGTGFGANSIESLINGLSTASPGGFEDGSFVGLDTTWSGDFDYGKVIADTAEGSLGLRKMGDNKLTLSGISSYTGETHVDKGTLAIDGDMSGATGAVIVGADGLLMGSGTIGGATTVAGGLNPGNSPGTLSFVDDLTLEDTSTLTLEFETLTSYDKLLNITAGAGVLTFEDGASIVLDFTGAVFADGDNLTVFEGWETYLDNGGEITVVGTDETNLDFTGLLDGGTIEVVAAIPEPAVISLVGIFGLGILFFKRRMS